MKGTGFRKRVSCLKDSVFAIVRGVRRNTTSVPVDLVNGDRSPAGDAEGVLSTP